MHTEHLQNVRFFTVLMGWLIAIALASLLLLTLLGFGGASDAGWGPTLAVLIGFVVGGFASGFRALEAPVLHGLAIGLLSVVAASIFAILNSLMAPAAQWTDLSANDVIVLMLAQFAAAVIGALLGYNVAVRGRPGLGEPDFPE